MEVRIAAVSDDLSPDFARAARIAAEAGLDGMAVRNVYGANVADIDVATVRTLRVIADDCGLGISAVTSPIGRGLMLDDDDAASLSLLDRMSQYADILGTALVRVFARWRPGRDDLWTWAERPDGASLSRAGEAMTRLAQRAESNGVTLMVELEGASHVGTVAEAASLFRAVNSSALALCWDVCNGWWSGEDPWTEGWPVARSLSIVDVQAKDVAARPGDLSQPTFEQVVLGEGGLPYAKIIGALLGSGYSGWFTAERVYHPLNPDLNPRLLEAILADIAELRRLVKHAQVHTHP